MMGPVFYFFVIGKLGGKPTPPASDGFVFGSFAYRPGAFAANQYQPGAQAAAAFVPGSQAAREYGNQ